ncbi:ERF family protein [Lactococcus garvieae]|uniref:ERF family protein n=1 Tax=Lactococcus garvieae TaxID=1363 RepID=UPI001BCC59CC|nr:ERF family protein [Lactococcus garvieae]MBS4463478.1 ERF family protein [Lactococcus garvieae]
MKSSESVAELFKALNKFRGKLKQPLKDANNPFFKSKYVPLENVVSVIDEAIANTGLSYTQETVYNESGLIVLDTIITHESGEYVVLGGAVVKPVKNDPQGVGSAITYARRYSLSTAFGIASDPDDDGNEASGGKSVTPKNKNPKLEPVLVQKIRDCQSKTALQQLWEKIPEATRNNYTQEVNKRISELEKAG